MPDKLFWDTNLWIYRLVQSEDLQDQEKQAKVNVLLQVSEDIFISTQILNEICNVLLKKFSATPEQVLEKLNHLKKVVTICPLEDTHTFQALELMKKYQFQWFDSLVVAAALSSQCSILYSEDMQHDLMVEKQLTIQNPFHKKS
jgi:predicted nucleic acid-binding protein